MYLSHSKKNTRLPLLVQLRFFGCALALLLCPVGRTQASEERAEIAISTSALAPAGERFGVNIDYEDFNNWTIDPGFEPQILRLRLTADGGGESEIIKDKGATTSYWDTLGDGFFNGATVRVYRAEQGVVHKLREATVSAYWASEDNGYSISLGETGAPVQSGDLVFLDLAIDNPRTELTHERMTFIRRSVSGLWEVSGPATYLRDSSTQAPIQGGKTSLRLATETDDEVSISQYCYGSPDSSYPQFVPGRTYRLSVWLKQEGLQDPTARFRLTGNYAGQVDTAFPGISDQWQHFTHDFTGPPHPLPGSSIAQHVLAFTGPGTLWVDNLTIHEPDYPLLDFNPEALQALVDFRPGAVRIWSGQTNTQWGTTLENWTNSELLRQLTWDANAGSVMTPGFGLPTALATVRRAGGTPWLIVGNCFNEEEWLGLIEYLAGPTGTQYGDRRADSGQLRPWTEEFDRIRIEYSNESWNPMFSPWDFSDPVLYSAFAEYFFSVAKTSPYWEAIAHKLDFVVNGWFIQSDANGFGARAVTHSPSSSIVDITAYVGGWEAGGSVVGELISDAGFAAALTFGPREYFPTVDAHVATQRELRNAGHAYGLAVYEGGPGYDLPTPGTPANAIQEIYGKSLAGATATLDCFLYNAGRGISPQCFFRFQPGQNWATHTTPATAFRPHPCFLALEMYNRYTRGAPVATRPCSMPVTSVAGDGQLHVDAVSLVQTYAFREGDRWSVFVLSRSPDRTIPVTLRLPFSSAESGTQYSLTGRPSATNLVAATIGIKQQDLPLFAPNFELDLPPASVLLFVWTGCQLVPLPEHPLPTISLHHRQSAVTGDDEVRFVVSFTEPVQGFASEDVAVLGDALADVVAVEQSDPLDASTYLVCVRGMKQAGMVRITVAEGAATTSDGRSSQTPAIMADSVQFSPSLSGHWILAYDDFNLSPDSAPYPPFLAEVDTGAGWAGGWNVQEFVDPQSYADGYHLATGDLAYDGLLRIGNHLVGGRSYQLAGRQLDVGGHFGHALVEQPDNQPTIGRLGTTLWISFLLRKDVEAQDECLLHLARAPLAYDHRIAVGTVFDSDTGKRRWTLALARDETLTLQHEMAAREATSGTTNLVVLRCDFAYVSRFRLWIDPAPLSTEEAPVVSDLDVTGTPGFDYSFRSIGVYPGADLQSGSVDEIRLGNTYLSVTPSPGTAAAIEQPPAGGAFTLGSEVVLATQASGNGLSYQWRKNGRDIPGATQSTLELSPFLRDDAAVYDVTLSTDLVTILSAAATVTFAESVGTPEIVLQPQPAQADVGDMVTLLVEASGLPAPTYQWQKDGLPIGQATARMLALPYALPEDSGLYRVTVTNEHGSVISEPATLTVAAGTGSQPSVLRAPYSQTFRPGQTFALSVLADGYPWPTYQWRKDGADIPGATSPALVVHNAGEEDAGDYTVAITNTAGQIVSPVAEIRQEHLVTVSAANNGQISVQLSDGTIVLSPGWVAQGESLTLLATADFAYAFDRWQGNFGQQVNTTSPQITFPLAGPLSVQALFKDGDWDQDGLPDPWELSIWPSIDAEGAGPTDNPDFDLLNNLQEHAINSNPLRTTIALLPGWNLVSVPQKPPAGASLQDQIGPAASLPIWSWDGTAYSRADAQGRDGAATPLEPTRAYWIHALELVVFEPAGTKWDNGVADLEPGWNLVGPVFGGELPEQSGQYRAVWLADVWTWDADVQRYVPVRGNVQSTRGYWLFTTESPQLPMP